jgi:hypothetical protein
MDATRSSRNGEYVAIPDDGDASAAMRAKQRERNEWTSAKFVAYGVGHVLNDMCASTWFSYLLVFLRQVRLQATFASVVAGGHGAHLAVVIDGSLGRVDVSSGLGDRDVCGPDRGWRRDAAGRRALGFLERHPVDRLWPAQDVARRRLVDGHRLLLLRLCRVCAAVVHGHAEPHRDGRVLRGGRQFVQLWMGSSAGVAHGSGA